MDGFLPKELMWRSDFAFIGNLTGYFLTDAAILCEGFTMDFVVHAVFGISAFIKGSGSVLAWTGTDKA